MYTHVQLKTNVHCWEMFVNKRNYWLTWKYSTSLNILYCLINIKLDTELWQIDNILHIDFVHVYNIIPQLITVYIYHKHERPWFFPRLLIVTTLIKSIKKCQQTDEIYANRYNYEYNNNYLCLYTTCTIKNKCALLRDVCEQEKLLVNMKIQYQIKYKKCLKIFLFLFLCMYLPVQAQSNPCTCCIQTQVIIIVFIIISIGVNLIGLLTFFDSHVC
jgi:hypothetical protein